MKITEVSYGLTLNLGDYKSLRIDATSRVSDGEDPKLAMLELAGWVGEQANEHRQLRNPNAK